MSDIQLSEDARAALERYNVKQRRHHGVPKLVLGSAVVGVFLRAADQMFVNGRTVFFLRETMGASFPYFGISKMAVFVDPAIYGLTGMVAVTAVKFAPRLVAKLRRYRAEGRMQVNLLGPVK